MKKIYLFLLIFSIKNSFAQSPTNKLDSIGPVGIGTTIPAYPLDVHGANQRLYYSTGSAYLRVDGNGTTNNTGSNIYLNSASTRVGDVFKKVGINANKGTDNTAYFQLFRMDEGDVDKGAFYQYSDPLGHRFLTAASRTLSSTTEVMRISPEGRMSIGSSPVNNAAFSLSATLTRGTGNFGIYNNNLITGTNSTYYYLNYSRLNTQSDSVITLPLVAHFTAVQGTVDANTNISAQTAFWASNSLLKGNHIHGFRGSIPLGTNNWNLYMEGDANNYLEGRLGIGSASPQSPLHISKAISGNGVVHGVYTNGIVQTGVTTANLYSSLAQTVTTTNLTSLVHFNAQQGSINASGVSQTGFNVSQNLNTGSNVYGFRGQVVNSSNRWNLYMDGTAANYLNGNLGIATLNPTQKLHVTGNILTSAKVGFNNDITNYYIGGISNGMEYRPYNIGKFNFTSGNGTWLFENGNVAIGTSTVPSGYKVAIAGNMIVEKIKVKKQVDGAWPDYVFSPTYKLQSLDEVEQFTKKYSHLPEIPSAKEIEKEGQDLGEMNRLLLKKVEELTLYLIEERKTNIDQGAQLKQLQEEINQFKKNLR